MDPPSGGVIHDETRGLCPNVGVTRRSRNGFDVGPCGAGQLTIVRRLFAPYRVLRVMPSATHFFATAYIARLGTSMIGVSIARAADAASTGTYRVRCPETNQSRPADCRTTAMASAPV